MSTSSVIEEMLDDLEEFVNLTDGVGDMLEQLHSLGEVAAPAPSGELALLLVGTAEAPAPGLVGSAAGAPGSPHAAARRSVLVGLVVAVVVAMGVTSAAAAVNELPRSMQRVVAHFSEAYLPFSFPRPLGDPPATRGTRRDTATERSTGATKGTRTDGSSAEHRQDAAARARAHARAEARDQARDQARNQAQAHRHDTASGPRRSTGSQAAGAHETTPADGAHSGHAGDGGNDGDSSAGTGDSGGTTHEPSTGGGPGQGTGPGGSQAHQGHETAPAPQGPAYAGQGNAGKGAPATGPEVHPGKPTSGIDPATDPSGTAAQVASS